jgi:carboxyl-terminal processing protease
MPPRNLNVILLACVLSFCCYWAHIRTKSALHVSDALNLINDHYVDPIDDEELLIAALEGMTSKLDDHSEFIPSHEFESFQDNISQEFAGIGIFVEQPEEGPPVRVVTPLVGSPALKAGMLPGDRFIRVDGEDVSSLGLQAISTKLKGPVGTEVNVVVRRGEQEVEMTINRATIELESVIGDYRNQKNEWVYRLQDDPTIAYVRLTGFGEKTVDELQEVLLELNNEFSAMIFDLRGNGGGLLDAAIAVSDMFLDNGEIVMTKTRGGANEDSSHATLGTLVEVTKPLAILIDEKSASASEIVSACLQDHDRASIVGTRSYGKGTVQNILPLQYGHSALRLTVARFYRPSRVNLHRSKDAADEDDWGVRPNVGLEVVLDEESRKQLDQLWREASYPALTGKSTAPSETGEQSDTAEKDPLIDPQLQRAIEHLRDQLPAATNLPAAA